VGMLPPSTEPMEKLIPFTTTVLGSFSTSVEKQIEFPHLVAVSQTFTGKSSVLNRILGRDLLPVGDAKRGSRSMPVLIKIELCNFTGDGIYVLLHANTQ
jgi:hypothetical protein